MPGIDPGTDRLAAQAIFCIDEREESLRRALEEVDPSIETYGAAGFFGCAIDYAGIDDPEGVSLCPVVVKPGHEVRETPVEDESHLHQKRQFMRRLWAKVVRNGNISTRTLVRGSLSTAFLGFFSLFPMALRILTPLAYAKLMRRLNDIFLPEPRTELTFMRDDDESRNATSGLMQGFSVQEMADRVASVLGPVGMHNGHARLVIILGHGSTSLNNPFVSAYCCGACGGRSGAPNARLFALMANRPAVRERLRQKGILIPEDTWFLGGYHDTCNDNIDLYDVDLMPPGHQADLAHVRESLDKARARSAHERTRRFELAGTGLSVEEGLRHVQERAEHLGEPRPEYGHCTNAVAVVGRRETTRGLFLDRRAFLVSYDATKDPEDKALAAVLGAVIPVCGGISLEYYFSTVDNEGYGCGTKLPHNITGLVGVMNGYQGDIRTGLPLQPSRFTNPCESCSWSRRRPNACSASFMPTRCSTSFSKTAGSGWPRSRRAAALSRSTAAADAGSRFRATKNRFPWPPAPWPTTPARWSICPWRGLTPPFPRPPEAPHPLPCNDTSNPSHDAGGDPRRALPADRAHLAGRRSPL